MIKLRLKKYGRKGQPCYRIVAMNSGTKRDGRSLEELGFYNIYLPNGAAGEINIGFITIESVD